MLQKQFENYLLSLGISSKSFKNYRSDLSNFFSWVVSYLKGVGTYIETVDELVPFLSDSLVKEYKTFLVSNSSPDKSINRRLSTLRHLSRFLLASEIINFDFMQEIQNNNSSVLKKSMETPLLDSFRSHLENEKVSSNTIKNYLSDVRQFLSWLESNNAHSV